MQSWAWKVSEVEPGLLDQTRWSASAGDQCGRGELGMTSRTGSLNNREKREKNFRFHEVLQNPGSWKVTTASSCCSTFSDPRVLVAWAEMTTWLHLLTISSSFCVGNQGSWESDTTGRGGRNNWRGLPAATWVRSRWSSDENSSDVSPAATLRVCSTAQKPNPPTFRIWSSSG